MAKVEARSNRPTRPLWKRILFSCVAGAVLLALLEGSFTAFFVVRDVAREFANAPEVASLKEDSHCQYDEELGWINIPSTQITDFYEPGASITINADGVRGPSTDHSYTSELDTFRVVCLGDSFTLGYGVDDRSTFARQLQERCTGIETINMGQGGYSIGQSFLWLRKLAPVLQPDVVVGVFIVEDFRRLLVTRTANGYATPQFELDGTGVVVSNLPVPPRLPAGDLLVQRGVVSRSLLQHSSLARAVTAPFQTEAGDRDAQCLLLGSEIIREIRAECRRNHSRFVLVITPTLPELHDRAMISAYQMFSQVLRRFADKEGIPFHDLWQTFADEEKTGKPLFLAEQFHHYNRDGNALVAESLADWLPTVIEEWPTEQ